MAYSVVICDDLAEERETLSRMVQAYAKENLLDIRMDIFPSGQELLRHWYAGHWNIAFLDIYMEEPSGITVAHFLRDQDPNCSIVFATTSRDHGITGYDLHIMDYLVKPITQTQVNEVLGWYQLLTEQPQTTLTFRSEWNDFQVPIQSILYVEVQNHILVLYTDQKTISAPNRLAEAEEILLSNGFFQCHRSFYINLARVDRMDKQCFYMDNQIPIPISRNKITEARKAIMLWDLSHHAEKRE